MKRPYTDAHLHLTAFPGNVAASLISGQDCMFCSSVFTMEEWQKLCKIEALVESDLSGEGDEGIRILKAFGVHPQNPDINALEKLEKLLSGSVILPEAHEYGISCIPDAIGEAGYDFFTKVYEAQEKEQDAVWYAQIELAASYGKPLVVHLRHAVDRMFRDAALLKKLPSVIFHSFPGSPLEAEALRKRGINAYFSFGKPILNNRKNSIECVQRLPDEWLLFETDAPFQTLKGETVTSTADIARVYAEAARLRGYDETDAPDYVDEQSEENGNSVDAGSAESGCERLAEIAAANFRKAFLLE